jgi:hypothetical protein
MSRRLKRIRKPVDGNRLQKRRATALPFLTEPERERKIAALAQRAKALQEQIDAAGGFVRVGGPDEPKRAEPLPEWKKPPPEIP